jgi:hypothetical protein
MKFERMRSYFIECSVAEERVKDQASREHVEPSNNRTCLIIASQGREYLHKDVNMPPGATPVEGVVLR